MVYFFAGKGEYREKVWFDGAPETQQMSATSKALFWVEQAAEFWQDTLSGARTFTEATSSATERGDFIHQVAHINSMTPAVIPYQYGETYSYFAVAFIPRILWPNKPLTGNANSFFAVAYGISTEEGVKTSTFGVSLLGEAFINFGWFGVVLVMMFQGIVLRVLSILRH